jgi:hypothetical protein
MLAQRGSEIEFKLNARVLPRDLANYRYRTPGGCSAISDKVGYGLGWDNLPFRRLSPYDVLAYSNFPSFLISFQPSQCRLADYVTPPRSPPPHILIWRRDFVKMAVLCWAQGSWVQPFQPYCVQNASFIPTHINYAPFELYHQSVVPNVISILRWLHFMSLRNPWRRQVGISITVQWHLVIKHVLNNSQTIFRTLSQNFEKRLLASSVYVPPFVWNNLAVNGRIFIKFYIWVSFEILL